MAEQRVPNLEEMNEQEVHRFLTELFSSLSAQEEYELRHRDYVMEMPQSGESIRGRADGSLGQIRLLRTSEKATSTRWRPTTRRVSRSSNSGGACTGRLSPMSSSTSAG